MPDRIQILVRVGFTVIPLSKAPIRTTDFFYPFFLVGFRLSVFFGPNPGSFGKPHPCQFHQDKTRWKIIGFNRLLPVTFPPETDPFPNRVLPDNRESRKGGTLDERKAIYTGANH
jgi:hypothetical protein